MAGYRKNYIKIYFWQLVSFLLNFAALFIVTPLLSSTPEIFGVYSVCVGLNIFLQYADIGFLVAGKKFAAETIVTGDAEQEKKLVGTSMFIYASFSLLVLIGILACACYPNVLISGISNNPEQESIARQLLLILCFSVPVTYIQKFVEFIYSLRLEEYKIQRLLIIANVIRIVSVPLYFFHNRYDIVGYYAFSQFATMGAGLCASYNSKRIGYGISSLFSVCRYHKPSFDKMKGLALSGFGSTISWILFYEIDTVAISALLGAKAVAIYAIGRTAQGFVRTLNGIVYGPYNVRFNYFMGNNDIEGMKRFFYTLTSFLSFMITPIIALCVFAKPFVIAWVGPAYEDSVIILQILVLCFIFNSISNPCSSIIFSFNKVREVLKLSIIQPLIFWIGIASTVRFLGIESFAYFKLLGCLLSALYCLYISSRILNLNKTRLLCNDFILPIILAILSSSLVQYLSIDFLHISEKSSNNLIVTILWMAFACVVSYIGYLCFYTSFRKTIFNILNIKKL